MKYTQDNEVSMNKITDFIKKEFSGFGKYEKIIFPLDILLIIALSIYLKDNIIAIISAIFGISYTIMAGKGKVSCYSYGLAGTLCYAFLSFKNALWGNLILYLCYYFPMQIYGMFKWSKNLKPDKQEITKTQLTTKERLLYFIISTILTIILYFILKSLNDQNPLIDSITSIYSIFGLLLTVKRCIEQWHIWFIVNGLSTIMWIQAYINGSKCFATVLMWATYFILSIYFMYTWYKDLKEER